MTIEGLSRLATEQGNLVSDKIDTCSPLEIVEIINREDQTVALAVKQVLPQIAKGVQAISEALSQGGRLIYCGAGTSGRLGVLDASECPPTYGIPARQVIGLIAGGPTALLQAVENAEDSTVLGREDLQRIAFSAADILVGIAASGRTPYVIGAMRHARSMSARIIALSCQRGSKISRLADIAIEVPTGAEVITGSTRMKAGTAQKMVLNMLSTGAMIRLGKVYGNLMVDVVATNSKLLQRQLSIVTKVTGCSPQQAEQALMESGQECKTAIVMLLCNLSVKDARKALEKKQGFLRPLVEKT